MAHNIYYTGDLVFDRSTNLISPEDRKVCDAAWSDYIAGKVLLVQKRIGLCQYEYRTIPCKAPFKPILWIGGIEGKLA